MATYLNTTGKKLSVKEMKKIRGGFTLSGCAGTGLQVVFVACSSNADCPILPIFCCGVRVLGICEEDLCSYGPTRCQQF
jgi:hypothetical protein